MTIQQLQPVTYNNLFHDNLFRLLQKVQKNKNKIKSPTIQKNAPYENGKKKNKKISYWVFA